MRSEFERMSKNDWGCAKDKSRKAAMNRNEVVKRNANEMQVACSMEAGNFDRGMKHSVWKLMLF